MLQWQKMDLAHTEAALLVLALQTACLACTSSAAIVSTAMQPAFAQHHVPAALLPC